MLASSCCGLVVVVLGMISGCSCGVKADVGGCSKGVGHEGWWRLCDVVAFLVSQASVVHVCRLSSLLLWFGCLKWMMVWENWEGCFILITK